MIIIIIIIIIITCFYIALFTPGGRPKALHIITPGLWVLIHILKPFQLPGVEYAQHVQMCNSAKSITRTNSALTGTHLPLGGEQQL